MKNLIVPFSFLIFTSLCSCINKNTKEGAIGKVVDSVSIPKSEKDYFLENMDARIKKYIRSNFEKYDTIISVYIPTCFGVDCNQRGFMIYQSQGKLYSYLYRLKSIRQTVPYQYYDPNAWNIADTNKIEIGSIFQLVEFQKKHFNSISFMKDSEARYFSSNYELGKDILVIDSKRDSLRDEVESGHEDMLYVEYKCKTKSRNIYICSPLLFRYHFGNVKTVGFMFILKHSFQLLFKNSYSVELEYDKDFSLKCDEKGSR